MTTIQDGKNIGPVLAGELRQAGIETLERLTEMGYLDAWRRIHAVNPNRDCTNSCLALAGAIEGIRWMKLPAERRAEIAAIAHAEQLALTADL
jgi:DNA transformation protein and related proteins